MHYGHREAELAFTGLFGGFGSACFGAVVCNSSVGKWFIRKRGVAIGAASILSARREWRMPKRPKLTRWSIWGRFPTRSRSSG